MSSSAIDIVKKLSLVTRAKDWRLSFVPFVMGGVYLWIWWFDLPFSGRLLWLTFLSLLTTIGFAALGYFINEFFDKEYDARAGKLNKLAFLSPAFQLGIFCGTLCFAFLPWLGLPFDKTSIGLVVAELVLFLIYSAPFPRWKENAYLSVLVDSAYAYVVPLLLSFHTFSLIANEQTWPAWLLCFIAMTFFMGGRNIIIHQIKDVIKDQRNGSKTIPILLDKSSTNYLLGTIFLYEVFFALLWLSTLALHQPIFALWLIVLIVSVWKGRLGFVNMERLQSKGNFTLNTTYQYIFPAFVLLLLFFKQPFWTLIILPIHLLFFVQYDFVGKAILLAKMVQSGVAKLYWKAHVCLRHVFSALINYPIYYLFLMFGVDLKKERKSAIEFLSKKGK